MDPSPQGRVQFGPFEVVSRIGVGGMGEVFHARLVEDGRTVDVALKLIRAEHTSDGRFRRMFEAEARVGALLDHPNIVRLISFGEIDQVPYLATELVDGASLDRLLSPDPLEVGIAVYIATELLTGLSYAHGLRGDDGELLRLVHRDVSASNVLVSPAGAIKLTDFGVAKMHGLSLTATNEVKGKRGYMAPEQFLGQPVDGRADVFAVGVLLHRLLTGRRAFDDIADWLPSGGVLAADVPLRDLLARALAIEPSARFPSAAAFAGALRTQVTLEPEIPAELGRRVARSRESGAPLAARRDSASNSEREERSSPMPTPRSTVEMAASSARYRSRDRRAGGALVSGPAVTSDDMTRSAARDAATRSGAAPRSRRRAAFRRSQRRRGSEPAGAGGLPRAHARGGD